MATESSRWAVAAELKPCPFCGPGQSMVDCYQDDYGYWTVGCGRCGSHSGKRQPGDPNGRQKVIDLWNTRNTQDAAVREERERAATVCDDMASETANRAACSALMNAAARIRGWEKE